jgi:hypothetical protein
MPINESIEYFPIFDPETTAESPGVSAAVGSGVAAVGSPDALGGGAQSCCICTPQPRTPGAMSVC